MARQRNLPILLALCLLGQAFSVPADRLRREYADNEVESKDAGGAAGDLNLADETSKLTLSSDKSTEGKREIPDSSEDDDDDDSMEIAPSTGGGGGGSNIFSLLRLGSSLFPGSSGASVIIRNLIREYIRRTQTTRDQSKVFMRREFTGDNEIDTNDTTDLKPPSFQRQETDGDSDESSNGDDDSEDESSQEIDDANASDNAAEESVESNGGGVSTSKQDASASNGDDSEDDSDEPPGGGDGQGGGILGILAGLSGGEDGSDLGTLLATVSGIVGSLSGGEGFDFNALLATGVGLFVGILSGGEENPGEVLASYLLTSLDTLTEGGSKNNGAFFGKFISTLIKGTSRGEQTSSEEENDREPMKDSGGFVSAFLMGLLGDMFKGSFKGSSSSQPWDRAFWERR